MSNEIVYAIFFALYSAYLSSPFAIYSTVGSTTLEITKDLDALNLSGDICFVLQKGKAVNIDNCAVPTEDILLDTFQVYYHSTLDVQKIEKYLEETNEYLENGMIGRKIFFKDDLIPITAVSQKILDFKNIPINENVVLFTDEDLTSGSSSNIVAGFHDDNSWDKHLLAVRLLPDFINSNEYYFDIRILVHEYLHIYDKGHTQNCKSIMNDLLSEDMGWFSVEQILQTNDMLDEFANDHASYDLTGIYDFIFPAPTKSDCMCESIGFGYLLDFENGNFIYDEEILEDVFSVVDSELENSPNNERLISLKHVENSSSPKLSNLLNMDNEISMYKRYLILFRGFGLLRFHLRNKSKVAENIVSEMGGRTRTAFRAYQSKYDKVKK